MRAIILDLDDTLYRSADFEASARRSLVLYLARRYRRDAERLLEALARVNGSLLGAMPYPFAEYLEAAELPEDESVALEDLLRRHEPAISLYPDAERFLAGVSPRLRIGVLAEGDPMVARNKLRALGLVRRVHAVVITGDGGEAWQHPSPLPLLAVARQMRVPAESAVFVGDDPVRDGIAAGRAGMKAIRVRRAGAPPSNGAAGDFCGEISSLEELLVDQLRAARTV